MQFLDKYLSEDDKQLAKYAGAALLVSIVPKWLYWHYKHRQLKSRAMQHKDQYRAKQPPRSIEDLESQLGKDFVENILDSDLTTLRQMVIDQKVKIKSLVEIFSARCYVHGRRLNLITHEFYEDALKMAEEKQKILDEAVKQGKTDQLGLFFGVPIVIKDQYHEKDKPCLVGSMHLIDNIPEKDAVVISILKSNGAIPLVRSTCPQFVMMGHTYSVMYGLAKNPYDPCRTTSGSSGGSGALVAARCTPFSLGSDVGGSTRAPAHCNGIIGFKGTIERLSGRGGGLPTSWGKGSAQGLVKSVMGPLCKSVDDVVTFYRAMYKPSAMQLDYAVTPIPFNETAYQSYKNNSRKLKIGVMRDHNGRIGLPNLPASDSTVRAVEIVLEKLREMGHDIVDFTVSQAEHNEFLQIYLRSSNISLIHGLNSIYSKYEYPDPYYKKFMNTVALPDCFKRLASWFFGLIGIRRLLNHTHSLRRMTTERIDRTHYRKADFLEKFQDRWSEQGLDAMISPCQYHCAFRSEEARDLGFVHDYFLYWNLLNCPTGVIPVTEVKQGEAQYEDEFNDLITKRIKATVQGSEGMPIGVQVTTFTWKDEECIGLLHALDDKIKYRKKVDF